MCRPTVGRWSRARGDVDVGCRFRMLARSFGAGGGAVSCPRDAGEAPRFPGDSPGRRGGAKGRSAAGRCGRACPRYSVLGFRSFERRARSFGTRGDSGPATPKGAACDSPGRREEPRPAAPGSGGEKKGSVAESGLCRFAVLPCRRVLRSALLLREGPGGCRASRRRPAASQARAQERTVGP